MATKCRGHCAIFWMTSFPAKSHLCLSGSALCPYLEVSPRPSKKFNRGHMTKTNPLNTAEHASWRAQTCLWVMALARRLRWCTQRPTGVDRPRTRALREPQNILYALLKDSYAHSKDCELGTHLRKLGPGRNVHSHLSIPLPAIPTPF